MPIRRSGTAERQFSRHSGKLPSATELACGAGDIRAALSKAPYVHTLHRRPHQQARRMIAPVRACVRARARALRAVCSALHVHVPYMWCSLLVAAGARLPADQCCSQRWRLTPRFAPSAQAQCAGAAGAAPPSGWQAQRPCPPARPYRGVPRRGLGGCFGVLIDFHPFICYWNEPINMSR